MTLALANRKDAVKARLADVFADTGTHFDVLLTRPTKEQERTISIKWNVFPFEDTIITALGDLNTADVTLNRVQNWSCGYFHQSERDAWEAHEGERYLEYPDVPYETTEKHLPDYVEDELIANGETFETECHQGNFIACPTCGGGAHIRDTKTFKLSPCPDCAVLGIDKNIIGPGMLDLDEPAHRAFYEAKVTEWRTKAQVQRAATQRKVDAALAVVTTTAAPVWLPLPTREAGLINGVPVHTTTRCDRLNNTEGTDRYGCDAQARWFDPSTALRVCTRHKTMPS